MKAVSQSQVLKISYTAKVKSFFISDGKAKVLIARQFTPMTRIQLQALHSSFIRCVTASPESSSLVTSQDNRFLSYQFVTREKEPFFFVLVTTAGFNIIEGEALLKSITRFILETISYRFEQPKTFIELIRLHAFDIILGLDDMINPITGNERLTNVTVASNLKMESTVEKEYKRVKDIQLEKAHNDLLKGMEEIERKKNDKTYHPGSISNEDISRAERDEELRLESQQMIKELTEERERERQRAINDMSGMNLNRHFLNRMSAISLEERESMSSFVNVCENIVQSMIRKELSKMNGEEEDDGEDNVMTAFSSSGRIVFAPIRMFYTRNEEDDGDDE